MPRVASSMKSSFICETMAVAAVLLFTGNSTAYPPSENVVSMFNRFGAKVRLRNKVLPSD